MKNRRLSTINCDCFKTEKLSTKLEVDLFGSAKIQTFYNRAINWWNRTSKNQYKSQTLTPTNCYKHFQGGVLVV